jgi:hypothetical protein
MKSVLPIGSTPEDVTLMQAAFDEACELAGCLGDDEAREAIGLHIIEGAQRGIRGVTQLRDYAVVHRVEIKGARLKQDAADLGVSPKIILLSSEGQRDH